MGDTMKVVTIGSFKGGTGKTTLSAAIATAMSLKGFKVRLIELDIATKPLARFEAARHFADLPHARTGDLSITGGMPDAQDCQLRLRQEIDAAQRKGVDVMIIDTVSVWKPEVIAAHLVADLVITTVTESPIDLYQIMPTDGPRMQTGTPYSELIQLVRRHADKHNRAHFDWFMCLNRRSHLRTRIGDKVREHLQDFSDDAGVTVLEGLVDRVGYRNMMATGVTPLDDIAGEPLQKSLLAARTETNLIAGKIATALGIRPKAAIQKAPVEA